MTPTSSIGATNQPMSVTPADSSKAEDKATIEATDFETFLRMLTTQIQNQDPLNPMESTDFAVQLATFSGVEQQVQTNELLQALTEDTSGVGLKTHAGWIGMEARVPGWAVVDGTPQTIHFNPPPGASRVDLIVKDSDGTELHRQEIAGRASPFVWEGRTPSGHPMPHGNYRIEVAGVTAAGETTVTEASVYARVAEIRAGDDGPSVLLDDGRELPAADVTALREPGT